VPDRIPERLGDLAGQGAARSIGDRPGDHHRPATTALLEQGLHGIDGGLRVQSVEDRLDQEQIDAPFDQAVRLLQIRIDELHERDVPGAGIVDVRRDRSSPVGRAERPGDVPRSGRIGVGELIAHRPGQPRRFDVQLVRERLHAVVGQRDALRIERIGLDEVRAGFEVPAVDRGDRFGLGQRQKIVVALEVATPVGEPLTPILRLAERVRLNHRAHRAVEQQDPGTKKLGDRFRRVRTQRRRSGHGTFFGSERQIAQFRLPAPANRRCFDSTRGRQNNMP
jgi:hypothetical protein